MIKWPCYRWHDIVTQTYEFISFHHIFGGTVEFCWVSFGSSPSSLPITCDINFLAGISFTLLHCIVKTSPNMLQLLCLVYTMRIIFGSQKVSAVRNIYICWAEELDKGNVTDQIFKCRINDKSLIERKCPDQNLFNNIIFNVRGKTKPQWQIAWGRE